MTRILFILVFTLAATGIAALDTDDYASGIPVEMYSGSGSVHPVSAEPRSLLTGAVSEWRQGDYEVYLWEVLPDILFFDTLNYRVQSLFFKRIAFFVEKQDFRGKVLSWDRVNNQHGYNAHNYGASDLADFFTKAAPESLSPQERMLRDICVRNGIILETSRGYIALGGGILSISRESTLEHRKYLLTHEFFHGVYYSLSRYRYEAEEIWRSLPLSEKRLWTLFLSSRGYDVSGTELVINEFQAYLVQLPSVLWSSFQNKQFIPNIVTTFPGYNDFVVDFFKEHPEAFRKTHARLEAVLRKVSSFDFLAYRDMLFSVRESETDGPDG